MGGYRYKFVGKKDIIIGPLFVTGTFRRKGYATYMLNKVLYEFEMPYKYAYCFVQKSNVASKKTFSGLGFLKFSDAKYSKYLRKLETCDSEQGNFIIYRFERNKI